MSARLSTTRLVAAARLGPRASISASSSILGRCLFCHPYSTDAPPPPLLAKLKGDLKVAMKAKDKTRLSVLRTILAAALNASKTDQPINSDARVVALLRKTVRASQDAAAEFRSANRADLAESEEAQIAVLEAYASESGLETLGPEQLQALVETELAALQAEVAAGTRDIKKGLTSPLMQRLLAAGGPLEGKEVDKRELAVVVKRLTQA